MDSPFIYCSYFFCPTIFRIQHFFYTEKAFLKIIYWQEDVETKQSISVNIGNNCILLPRLF